MYKYLMDKLLLIRKSQSTDPYQNHTVDAFYSCTTWDV